MHKLHLAVICLLLYACFPATARQKNQLTVYADRPQARISPTMWGVFFEDINYGADGGLYAELVKNRSFEFSKPLTGWKTAGFTEGELLALKSERESNPHFVRVSLQAGDKTRTLTNEGFFGMGIREGAYYDFSVLTRTTGRAPGLRVELIGQDGSILAAGQLNIAPGKDWQRSALSLQAKGTDAKALLRITFKQSDHAGRGQLDVDMVSLFPKDTWKGRPGGLRRDLVEQLAALKPGFLRFPGGCIVEGIDLGNRYRWKNTIGPPESRQLIMNRWNVEFANRPSPDYFQSFGLGFFEYFQLAEDLGAAPLPILNCGMACQYNTAEVVPLDELGPYIQDALDLVEFANGPVTSTWGKLRAALGHPEPFNLQYLGIGNENWGPQYLERAKLFQNALQAKYPEIKLIFSAGTDPDSERYHFLNKGLREMKANLIDEHYYRSPEWFLKNAGRYDAFPRTATKVFAGEYAAHSPKKLSGAQRNIWEAALAEAAFMTGLERNADVVTMASYAPLFAHTEGWQWAPDLIWFDNLETYRTPNYYVQQLFSANRGTHTLRVLQDGTPVSGAEGLYASAVADTVRSEVLLKVVNTNSTAHHTRLVFQSLPGKVRSAGMTLLSGQPAEGNVPGTPAQLKPVDVPISLTRGGTSLSLPPYSLVLIRVRYK